MPPGDVDVDRGMALAAAYAANFGALAASAPFLALLLRDAGFGVDATAQLLALCLLLRVLAIPVWTLVADRRRSAVGTLRLASAGALLVLVALAAVARPSPAQIALALAAFAVFRAPFGPLLDVLALKRARTTGRTFGGVRAWGTAGFAATAMITGAAVGRRGSRAVLGVSVVLLAAALVAAVAMGRSQEQGSREAPRSALRTAGVRPVVALAFHPRIAALLAVAMLQEIGLAPYDALFPAYLAGLAGATTAGLAVALGATAEFAFLLAGAPLVRRLGPERLLALACAASFARWAAMAILTSAPLLVGLQALHALSFGAFYLSAVLILDDESPPAMRASAQGIFGSLGFGVAAAAGVSLAGVVERAAGLRTVFAVASGASAIAVLVALRMVVRGPPEG
jgi:PPP family 3-phenylpropionic acid transporter